MSTSTVSATIQDPSGQVFAFGTWQLVFKPTPNTPGNFTDGGVSFTKLYGGSLDATGSFSQAGVNRNDTIAPAGSLWTLIVTPNANGQGYQVDLNVNSGAFNASSAINAAITNISVQATPIAHAYKDSEVLLTPNSGGVYYDVVNKVLKVWDTQNNTWVVNTIPQALSPSAHQFLTGMSIGGVFSRSQPASTDLSDLSTLVVKQTAAFGIQYASGTAGNDSNDGLSWASAKAKISTAIAALPSTGGVVFFQGTIAENSAITLKNNVQVIGTGSTQADSVAGPSMITTTLASGDLFYLNNFNDCHFSDFAILNIGTAGANAAFRLTAAQRNSFERIYITGPFAVGVQLDSSSTAPSSCIWNNFTNIHVTNLANNGIGFLLDSKDASSKVINGNFFFNCRGVGGATGASACGFKLTNSGVHNQVINENVFWASEAVANAGTAIQIDQGSTRGCVWIDCDAEGSVNGFVKQTTNTITFIGGNISSNGTNVTDAQPLFTIFMGTNVGGITQNFAITPIGNVFVNGLSVGGATPVTNQITGTTGWQISASGTAVATVNNTSFQLDQNLIFDSGKTITQYNGIVSPDYGVPVIIGTPVHSTGLTGNLAATSIYPAPVTGMYMVHFQARTTTAGTGTTGTVTITWADEGGAKSFTSGTWALNSVAFAGAVSANFPIHVNSGTAVQISTTVTIGTSVYAIDAWLERVA